MKTIDRHPAYRQEKYSPTVTLNEALEQEFGLIPCHGPQIRRHRRLTYILIYYSLQIQL